MLRIQTCKAKRILGRLFLLALVGAGGCLRHSDYEPDSLTFHACVCGETVVSNCRLESNLTCSGNGLVAGADGIILDGNGFALLGDGGSTAEPDAGVLVRDSENVTVRNFSVIKNFYYGIWLDQARGGAILDNSLNANRFAGLYLKDSNGFWIFNNSAVYQPEVGILLEGSSSNQIFENRVNYNIPGTGVGLIYSSSNNLISANDLSSNKYNLVLYGSDSNLIENNDADLAVNGIHLADSDSNLLRANRADSNWHGLLIEAGYNNRLSDNSFSGNVINLEVLPSGTEVQSFRHEIDATNMVEGKPVYYLLDAVGEVYDESVLGPIGMFFCVSCDHVTLQNTRLAAHNWAAVGLVDTVNSIIENVETKDSFRGVYLFQSSSNTVRNNVFDSEHGFDYLRGSAIAFELSSGNLISGNSVLNCDADFEDANTVSNIYIDNVMAYNEQSRMVEFLDTNRILRLNDTVNFTAMIRDITEAPCPSCVYEISTSPAEALSLTANGESVDGSFAVSRPGYYSLVFKVRDPGGNSTRTSHPFFVDANGTHTGRYYLRGIPPTHGQPSGSDAKSLTFTPPSQTEYWLCKYWVINTVDQMPDYPFSILSGVDASGWYKVLGTGKIGIQRKVFYWNYMDKYALVPESPDYGWFNVSLPGLDWAMSRPQDWYQIALKLSGTYVGSYPYWQTRPEAPSYADFHQIYTATPAVKSFSDYRNFHLLSATAVPGDTAQASIVIDGKGTAKITLSDFPHPFRQYPTILRADKSAEILVGSLYGETAINSVAMSIDFSSAGLLVQIQDWDTAGTFYKKWVEKNLSSEDLQATHVIKELMPDTEYGLKIDGVSSGDYLAGASGEIIFQFSGQCNYRTFELIQKP